MHQARLGLDGFPIGSRMHVDNIKGVDGGMV